MPATYVRDPACKYYRKQMCFFLSDPQEIYRRACDISALKEPKYRSLIEDGLKIHPHLLEKLDKEQRHVYHYLSAELRPGTRLVCLGPQFARKWALNVNPDYPEEEPKKEPKEVKPKATAKTAPLHKTEKPKVSRSITRSLELRMPENSTAKVTKKMMKKLFGVVGVAHVEQTLSN